MIEFIYLCYIGHKGQNSLQGPKQFLQNNIWRETVFVSDSKELQDAAAEAALEWREKA